MNICFASDTNRLKRSALDSVDGFYEIFSKPPHNIDILVLNGDCDISEYIGCNIDTCIFSVENSLKLLELKNVNSAISCGMQDIDSVTFSSISEDSALVCIRRKLFFNNRFIEPCEFKASFNRRFGIFQNLVISLIDFLSNRKGE